MCPKRRGILINFIWFDSHQKRKQNVRRVIWVLAGLPTIFQTGKLPVGHALLRKASLLTAVHWELEDFSMDWLSSLYVSNLFSHPLPTCFQRQMPKIRSHYDTIFGYTGWWRIIQQGGQQMYSRKPSHTMMASDHLYPEMAETHLTYLIKPQLNVTLTGLSLS